MHQNRQQVQVQKEHHQMTEESSLQLCHQKHQEIRTMRNQLRSMEHILGNRMRRYSSFISNKLMIAQVVNRMIKI